MKLYVIILTSLLVSACADNGYEPIALDTNFGKSVKQLSQAQLLNPKAAANPSPKVSKKLDGLTGQNIMNTYRTSFGQSQAVQPVTINIGGLGSSSGSSGK